MGHAELLLTTNNYARFAWRADIVPRLGGPSASKILKYGHEELTGKITFRAMGKAFRTHFLGHFGL